MSLFLDCKRKCSHIHKKKIGRNQHSQRVQTRNFLADTQQRKPLHVQKIEIMLKLSDSGVFTSSLFLIQWAVLPQAAGSGRHWVAPAQFLSKKYAPLNKSFMHTFLERSPNPQCKRLTVKSWGEERVERLWHGSQRTAFLDAIAQLASSHCDLVCSEIVCCWLWSFRGWRSLLFSLPKPEIAPFKCKVRDCLKPKSASIFRFGLWVRIRWRVRLSDVSRHCQL